MTSGLDELDTAADKAEDEAYKKALESTDVFPPFRKRKAGAGSRDADQKDEDDKMDEDTEEEDDPRSNLPALGIGLGEGLSGPDEGSSSDTQRSR